VWMSVQCVAGKPVCGVWLCWHGAAGAVVCQCCFPQALALCGCIRGPVCWHETAVEGPVLLRGWCMHTVTCAPQHSFRGAGKSVCAL